MALYLQDLLFESLACPLNSQRLGLSACKVAASKGHFDYVQRALVTEIEKGIKEEELAYLYELYKFWEVLEKEYRVEIRQGPNYPTPSGFSREYSRYIQAEQLCREFKENVTLSESEKKAFEERMRPISHPVLHSETNTFVKVVEATLRLRYWVCRFQGKFTEGTDAHRDAFYLIRENPGLFSNFKVLHAGNILVLLLKDQGKDLLARSILEDICSLEVEKEFEDYQANIWISNSLHLALSLHDTAVGVKAIQTLEENESLFPAFTKGYLYHLASLIHFSNCNWEKAIYYQNRSVTVLKRNRKLNNWSSYLIRAICCFEMGFFSGARRNLGILQKGQETEPNQYPLLIADLVSDLIKSKIKGEDGQQLLLRARSGLEAILHDGDVRMAMACFNALPWIGSHIKSIGINEILKDPSIPRLISGTIAS